MAGNLPCPSSRLAPLWIAVFSFSLLGQEQTHKVESGKTVNIEVAGATAAYSMDSSFADAWADAGVVTVSGKIHGATHVMVVTPAGVQTLDILVTDPPLRLPPGMLNPLLLAAGAENGFWESRYDSMADQVQSQIDFSRHQDENTIHMHVVGTRLLGNLTGDESRTQLSSAYYQILTPQRDITFLDEYLTESPLGINGSIVRGLHYSQDGWFLHTGYTSVSSFQGEFLPTRAEGVVEAGYRFPLGDHSSLTGTYYYFQVPSADTMGRHGSVGLLSYAYSPDEKFHISLEAGFSHGPAGSASVDYRSDKDNLKGMIRYAPSSFAALGANNLHGFHGDLSWSRELTGKLSSDVSAYSSTFTLPGIRESTTTATVRLQYRLAAHWSIFGGGTASTAHSILPPSAPVRSVGAPTGVSFISKHFGAEGQYQFTETSHQDSGGRQLRASVNSSFGPLSFAAFASQQTQAPTLAYILSRTPGLQQALDLLGLQATSIQQVEELLRDNAALFASGYIQSATLNLAPLRRQLGGSLNLAGKGHWPQCSYNILYSDDLGLSISTASTIHSLLCSEHLGPEQVSLSLSLFGTKSPGQTLLYQPSLGAAWRHEFHRVPSLLIPVRHGTISGVAFRDDNSKGTYEDGMPTMPGVQVTLDGARKMETDAHGAFRFSSVPVGKHQLAANYRSAKPTFFSTQSQLEVEENATVNFGIGYSLSSLTGRVGNDVGQGVGGVGIRIRNKDQKWTAVTESDGGFLVRQLGEGEYQAEVDEDSVPAGYLTAELAPQTVSVGAATPGKAEFTMRALRSIAGRVLMFDMAAGKSIPVAARTVSLKEAAKTSMTDSLGRYVFRDLAPGTYTVGTSEGSAEVTRSVTLPSAPLALSNIDLQIGQSKSPPAEPTAPAAPAPPMVLPPAPVAPAALPPAALPPAQPPAPPASDQPQASVAAPVPRELLPNLSAEHERAGRQKLAAEQ